MVRSYQQRLCRRPRRRGRRKRAGRSGNCRLLHRQEAKAEKGPQNNLEPLGLTACRDRPAPIYDFAANVRLKSAIASSAEAMYALWAGLSP